MQLKPPLMITALKLMKMEKINITDNAAQRINSFLKQRGKGEGLRLGVKTSGCSGLAYLIEYVDSIDPNDICFNSNGIKLFVDPKSLVYLEGVELDYTKEGLNEGFKFNNPNASGECGCGESFTV